jgi:rubrerythrin
MPDNKPPENTEKELKVVEKKIQFGDNEYLCFACGEKIASDTSICPYCKTAQDKKELY